MRSFLIGCGLLAFTTLGACGGREKGGPSATVQSTSFRLGGQQAWFHDEGHAAGFFHTYDALKVGSANNAPRKVHVFLPRDYEENRAKRYPVVYMNDGHTAFWPGGLAQKSWRTAEVLSDLYARNAIRKVIVVAVHPRDRDFEYTHEEVLPGRPWGGLANYARYLASDLKPWIDAYYRTLPTRAETAIIGSSHGGLAAFYTAGVNYRHFGFAGCLSPSFWVGVDTVSRLFGSLRHSSLVEAVVPGLSTQPHPRIWIDWGLVRDGGMHNALIEARAAKRGQEMAKLLTEEFGYTRDQDLFTFEDPAGDHTEEAWSRRLPKVLEAFAGTESR